MVKHRHQQCAGDAEHRTRGADRDTGAGRKMQAGRAALRCGAEIPEELLSKMIVARKLFAGLAALRQLEFGLFDLSVFTQDSSKEYDLIQLYKNVIENYGVIPYWEGTYFPYSFSHIFGGGYAAGYYSYKWSEVLEADAFTRFKEDGVLSETVGRAFRDTILSRGDSKEALELYIDFMGREPKDEALLKKLENTL